MTGEQGQPSRRRATTAPTDSLRFGVRGLPVAQGSHRAFVVRGRPFITTTAKGLAAWRRLVADVAQRHAPSKPWDGPLSVEMTFTLPKPKSAPRTRRSWPDKRPDLDKLCRSVLDAISHVVIADDSKVVRLRASKDYGPPGVVVEVVRLCPWCGLPRDHTPTRDCTGLNLAAEHEEAGG